MQSNPGTGKEKLGASALCGLAFSSGASISHGQQPRRTMNIKRTFLALAALAAATTSALAQPAVSARQALDLAEKSLAERGLAKKIYVDSVSLDHDAIKGGQSYWFVRWSESFPAQTPGRREIGIKVSMDRSVVRLVK
jgi:hypothetical protein